MKKAKKKLNKIKTAPKKPTKVVGKPKAMAVKAPKKPQTKAPKAAKPAKAAPAPKTPLKQMTAALSKMLKTVKGAPAKPATPAKAPKTEAPAKLAKGAKAPAPAATVVAAVLTKPAKKVKAEGKGAKSKLTGAELAAHLERMCRENACENLATTKGYCRLDYIKNWKKIKRKEMILKEGKLNQYIEELVSKYPDKYIDVIRQDLSTEVNFTKVIHDLELDESIDDLDYDGDSIDSLIGSIKKEDGAGGGDDEF